MMNKLLYFLLCSLLILPGCFLKRKKQEPKGDVKKEQVSVVEGTGDGKKSGLNEDVEAFVLEQEANPFTAPINQENESVSLLDQDQDQFLETAPIDSYSERAEQMVKHGLKTLYFDFDQYMVRPDQKDTLKADAQRVKNIAKDGTIVVIEGHACNSAGSAAYNMMLSEKRAKVVYDYFVTYGIDPQYLKVVGRGFEMCVVPEGGRMEQAPNRRVETLVYPINSK
jgi:outer membrane protein OmpA-like peptidoglycan-associated protein